MGLPYWTAPAPIETKEASKADLTASQRSPIRRRPSLVQRYSRGRAHPVYQHNTVPATATNRRPPQIARRSGALEPLSPNHRRAAEDGYADRDRGMSGVPPPPVPAPMPEQWWFHDGDGALGRRRTQSPLPADDELRRLPPLRRMSRRNIADGPLPSSSLRETWSPIGPYTASGLGDRDRSFSPAGEDAEAWDTMLSTIAPDTQLPSFDSSFTSAAASASASFSANRSNQNSNSNSAANSVAEGRSSSASASSSRTHLTIPSPTLASRRALGTNCPTDDDLTNDDTASDTEDDEVTERLSHTHHPRSPPPRRTSGIRETLRNRPWISRGSRTSSSHDMAAAEASHRIVEEYDRLRRSAPRAEAIENHQALQDLRSFNDPQERTLERNRRAIREGTRNPPERILSLREHLMMEHQRTQREQTTATPEEFWTDADPASRNANDASTAPAAADEDNERRSDALMRDVELLRQIDRDIDNENVDAIIDASNDEGDASRFLRHYESFVQSTDGTQRELDGPLTEEADREESRRQMRETLARERQGRTENEVEEERLLNLWEQASRSRRELHEMREELEREENRQAEESERDRHDPTLAQASMLGNDPELETMRAILERMSRRDDIPESWWLSAGLSPSIARGRL